VFLSICLENLGEQYVDLGRVGDALPYYLDARDRRRQLHASHPENLEYAQQLGDALMVLGGVYRHAGDWDSARDTLREARHVMESLTGLPRDDPARQASLAVALTRESESLADLKQTNTALETLDKAITIWSKLAAIPAVPDIVSKGLSESLWERARLLRASGKSADAEKLDLQREALWKGRAAGELVALADEEASRATLIGLGATPISEEGQYVRQLDLDQAAAHLRLAIGLGYSDLTILRSNPRLAPLLLRDDIKPLIMRLETTDRSPGSSRSP
jgi:tetratricopeptide (TPR) repeat protein